MLASCSSSRMLLKHLRAYSGGQTAGACIFSLEDLTESEFRLLAGSVSYSEAICNLVGRLNPQQLISTGGIVLCRLLTIDPKALPHSCKLNPKTLVLALPGNLHIEMFHQRHAIAVPDMLHCGLACWVPFSHGSDLANYFTNGAPKVVAMLNCTLESIGLSLECRSAHPLQSARSKSQKMELVSLSSKTRCSREIMKSAC